MASVFCQEDMETDTSQYGVRKPAEGQTAMPSCIRPTPIGTPSPSETGELKFNIAEYKTDAFEMMWLMKSNSMLTDVHLEVGREIFQAHKVVLAAASPYFKAMFTSGHLESDMKRVKLQGVSPLVMEQLLRFMYSGKIVINEMLVCQLLPAATMYQMEHVIEACGSFLEKQLDASNAIGIASFAHQQGCMGLYRKANAFIEQHFSMVSHEEEFLELSVNQLIDLIKRDELNVPDERDVYNAVLKWVTYDEANRHPKMEHILHVVRCQYLSPRFLDDQMNNCSLLRKAPACREYLAKIFRDLTLHKPPEQKKRTPRAPCVIYIVGGFAEHKSVDTLECFDAVECQWTKLSRLPVARSGLGAAYINGMFYAVGGRQIMQNCSYPSDVNWLDCYNPLTNEWRQYAGMRAQRNRLGVAVLDGLIYAVGGSHGAETLNSVERYDPEEDTWAMVKPMMKARTGVGLAVFNRLLYAVGGFDGKTRLNYVEVYHPENDEWTFVAQMKIPRSGAGVCAFGNHIYAIGGYDGSHQLSSVERFDPVRNEWHFVAPINTARSAMTVTAWDGKIYVMGGYDGQRFLSSVEVLAPRTGTWSMGNSLPWGRSGHASASSFQACLMHADHR